MKFNKNEKSDYQRVCFILYHGWRNFLLADTKRWTKKYIYKLEKWISLVYNINYYLIVPIDRVPQRLYSQRYSYRWRNTSWLVIFDNCVFDSLISVDELLAKALQRFVTCLLVNNNLCGKLVSSSELPTIFDDNLRNTSVWFYIAKFNSLRCESDSFIFKLLYWVILYY